MLSRATPVRRGALPVSICLWSVLSAGVALAGTPGEATAPTDTKAPPEAKALFARGRELRLAGDCASAVPVFQKAYALYPEGLGSLRNVAECEEALGHWASALSAWRNLQRSLHMHRQEKYDGWDGDAKEGGTRLAPRVASMTIDVEGNSEPVAVVEADVTVNGEPLDSKLVGAPVEHDPGRYVVRVTGAGLELQERQFDLHAGESRHVLFHLVRRAQPPEFSTHGEPLKHDKGGAGPTGRAAGWIAVGVGGMSLIAAAVAAGVYQSALDDLNRMCPNRMCNNSSLASRSEVDAIHERGSTAGTVVDISLLAGGIAMATGVVLFTVGNSRSASTGLVVSPHGMAAIGRF